MTRQEQLDSLIPYLEHLQGRMGLRDWKVDFELEPSDKESGAQIGHTRGRKLASIRLSWDFFDKDPKEQRHLLVHELVHCHFFTSDDFLYPLVSDGDITSFNLLQELGIDAMADALAPHMPHPPAQVARPEKARMGF